MPRVSSVSPLEGPVLACVAHGPGDLRVEEVTVPNPGPGEIAVDIAYGGICGSDLHYATDGAVGDFTIRSPLILGHEIVGRVSSVSSGSSAQTLAGAGLSVGDPVAVHPATVCGQCLQCLAGHTNLCDNGRYLGSAAHHPHTQGGFVERLVVPVGRAVPLPANLALERAVLAEPLSVALHAVRRVPDVEGRNVLIVGAGPIGCLTVAACRVLGAATVTASDVCPGALAVAESAGATRVLDAGRDPRFDVGTFDVVIEASGTQAGLGSAIDATARGGAVVAVGMYARSAFTDALAAVVPREISLLGSFRFAGEFPTAIQLLDDGLDVGQIVTAVRPLSDSIRAFDLAGDRQRSSKVVLRISS